MFFSQLLHRGAVLDETLSEPGGMRKWPSNSVDRGGETACKALGRGRENTAKCHLGIVEKTWLDVQVYKSSIRHLAG